jgi:uncharacterized protein (DUF1501 family)
MSCDEPLDIGRRRLLAGSASLAVWGLLPGPAIAGTRDPRLLAIILRGGLDGISMVAPVGDPDYERLRGRLAVPRSGAGAGLPLDHFFALNAGMPFLHQLYLKKEALILHAIHSPYRGRSHFDGQDVLESGLGGVARADDGWLNRALGAMPSAGRIEPIKGLAMGAVVPLVIRGAAPVLSWIPKTYGLPLRESTIARLQDLYAETDPALAKAFADGIEIDRVAAGMGGTSQQGQAAGPQTRPFREFTEAAEAAARFLAAPGGPRIGVLSFNGWDTHANEGVVSGVLATRLAGLDACLRSFSEAMGPAWRETVVVVVTEFGRTARANGTDGTDHGMATLALLAGGAVNGGRIIADWPGLKDAQLYEGRDLRPTRDLRASLKGVLRDHLGVPAGVLASTVFPDSAKVAAMDGLLA